MKKKVLSAIVCAAMVFSMTACGLQSPNTGGNSGGTTNAASTSNASATSDAAEAETTTEAASSGDSATEPVGPAVTLVYAEVNPLEEPSLDRQQPLSKTKSKSFPAEASRSIFRQTVY